MFFKNLGGEWASKRKKCKIVEAEDFVQGFPKGSKVLLGVRKKDSCFIIECHKYIRYHSSFSSLFSACEKGEVQIGMHRMEWLF